MVDFDFQNPRQIYEIAARLFPICRSITGNGVRETMRILREYIPLTVHEVPSGIKVFDWIVPREWNISDAFVLDETGARIIDFQKNNLHVVGYSVPVNTAMPLEELQKHLYSLPGQPDAIPYITSYYSERWGFCLTQRQRDALKDGVYRVRIDSSLKDGFLTYGELILPGKSEKEILLSTYICHPSMANNECSGPAVATALACWLLTRPREYTYRIVFLPETIGSITYLSRHADFMRKNTIAGFNLTCVGDERAFSFLPSRYGNTLADRTALHVLRHRHPDFRQYSFLDRGSDERQYCAPGIDLPVASIMRSKYNEYPEYHTSLDNLELITPEGLHGSFLVYQDCLEALEKNQTFRANCLCEPQLGRRNLYPTLSTKEAGLSVRNMMNFLAYSDGTNDLIAVADRIQTPVWELYDIAERLVREGLVTPC